ncbi:hypothetical protein [Methylobacterium phyllostachyos]|uniref:hypothetical protein n=1 Tax=Methylobacterium phyllostachyos TaxID=582672 RepID=UPI00142FE552
MSGFLDTEAARQPSEIVSPVPPTIENVQDHDTLSLDREGDGHTALETDRP